MRKIFELYKQCYILWSDLGFYIHMEWFHKANLQCEKIDTFKKEHPFINFTMIFK